LELLCDLFLPVVHITVEEHDTWQEAFSHTDIDATRRKFLSKNKYNYLQHHFVHNYKFSLSNKNSGMPGKITVK